MMDNDNVNHPAHYTARVILSSMYGGTSTMAGRSRWKRLGGILTGCLARLKRGAADVD